ncbi:g5885 [Coccomyxa elongata]
MEAQELDMDCHALLGSLTGLSRATSRNALTQTVAGLEAGLAPWTWPLQFAEEGPLLPFVELDGAVDDINQPISGLVQSLPSAYLTACFPEDTASSVPAGRLSPVPLHPHDLSEDTIPAGRAQCSLSLTNNVEESGTFQLPTMPAAGLASDACKHDVLWDVPWDEAAMQLYFPATPDSFSPAHSLNSNCCQALPSSDRDAPADRPCPIQSAGSTNTEASCASTAVQPMGHPPQNQACPSNALSSSVADARDEIAAALTGPPSAAGPPLRAAIHPEPDALVLSGSGAKVAGQACSWPAGAPPHAGHPPCAAADSLPDRLCGMPANTQAPATQLAAAAVGARPRLVSRSALMAVRSPRPPLGRPRALGAVQKVRQRQQAYSQRKKVRVAAVHATVEDLLEKLAALQRNVDGLLVRHEELTRERPWHQQHEEVNFMARLASSMPTSAVGCRIETALRSPVGVFQKLMLEPTATVSNLYRAAGCGVMPASDQSHESYMTSALAAQPAWANSAVDSGGIAWSSVLACLRLSKVQKDSLAALYDKHLQYLAAAHQHCLCIASKLQVLPTVRGELTDCMWPNMAACLVSSQLSSLAGREAELIADLTTACEKVLSPIQQHNLQALAPAVATDMRALCRELSANCRTPRKAPASNAKPAQPSADAAQPVTHTLLGSKAPSCHKTPGQHESFHGGNTIPQAAVIINVAAHAAMRPMEAAAPGNAALHGHIIADMASVPRRVQLAADEAEATLEAAAPGNAPSLQAAAEPRPNGVIGDVAQMLVLTQPAAVEEKEPSAQGSASALVSAAATVPACDGVIGDRKLMAVVAQLAAVSSEAAFLSVISAALRKRQALAVPWKTKDPSDDNERYAFSNAVTIPEEEAVTVEKETAAQGPFHTGHRKKARMIMSMQLVGTV